MPVSLWDASSVSIGPRSTGLLDVTARAPLRMSDLHVIEMASNATTLGSSSRLPSQRRYTDASSNAAPSWRTVANAYWW